jgi:hypothetical protein
VALEQRPLDVDANRASRGRKMAIQAGRWAYRRGFLMMQRAGVHVVPNHFYGPVPDTREIDENLWTRPPGAPGVDMNDDVQLQVLAEIKQFKDEYDRFPANSTGVASEFHYVNGKFGAVDAGLYYGILRHYKPRNILEIGSGNSTMVAAAAIALNEKETGEPTDMTVIDPYPHAAVADGFKGISKVIPKRVQDVPMEEFTRLESGDILFIDTSHVLKTGGDVQFEFLEILPRLKPGVIIHIHDIYLPAEYPREWVIDGLTFWSEQYILQAFLAFNSSFEVLVGGQYLHLYHPDQLRETFGLYQGESAIGSFWIRRTS